MKKVLKQVLLMYFRTIWVILKMPVMHGFMRRTSTLISKAVCGAVGIWVQLIQSQRSGDTEFSSFQSELPFYILFNIHML